MWSASDIYVTEDAEFRANLLGEGTLFPIDPQGTFISWPNFHDESSFTSENQNIVSWGNFCGHEGKSSALLNTTSTKNSSYNNSSETTSIESAKSMDRAELSLLQHDNTLQSCLNYTKRSRSNEDLRQVFGRNVKPRTLRRLDFSSSSINDGLGGDIGCSNGLRSSPRNTEEDDLTTCSILNPKSSGVKSGSSRGTATESQSLYARKRRERINERLRILQSIIPNGTKVDISTMLDEAVHYVKFLQLQIRLLSSDEMWMYAPIAYSGMDRTNVNSWT